MRLSLAVSPAGHLTLVDATTDTSSASMLDGEAADRLASAFSSSAGDALLHLATTELSTPLPAAFAYFRDVAHSAIARACAAPDILETARPPSPPRDDLETLAASPPPMRGAEYITPDVLDTQWLEVVAALRRAVASSGGTLEAYLREKAPEWHVVGRVCLHLAENKRDAARPFAFLATYATRLSNQARAQHVPLGQALREYAGAKNKAQLLALLTPVQRAAERNEWLRRLVDSGEIYHPLAWTPREAHAFLHAVADFEAAGLVVRLPNWWNPKHPPRPRVVVTVGERAVSKFGASSLLDFSTQVTLEGETLTADEIEDILAKTDGLALIKGKWVEVDRERLRDVLAQWRGVQQAVARDGVSFGEAMRLLSGASGAKGEDTDGADGDAGDHEWSKVVPGEWLEDVLLRLRDPSRIDAIAPGAGLQATLRPYQEHGVRWLWLLGTLGLGACLADDMGLGKTIQVIALLLLLNRPTLSSTSSTSSKSARSKPAAASETHLLVVPASLVANWVNEIRRFAPALRVFVAHGSAISAEALADLSPDNVATHDVVVTTYGSLLRVGWLSEVSWGVVVLDEAQAIKNPGARQTRAAKQLRARTKIALTGTPIENRLSDLWSLFDFLDPGLLGSAKAFGKLVKRLDGRQHDAYAPLRDLLRPYILRRLKTDKRVVSDLPDKTELRAYCPLTKVQAALYRQAVDELRDKLEQLDGIARRGLVLASLMRFKQICNHPSQWLGDGRYLPEASGKLRRLGELCEPIASRQEKVIVFTQFREMTEPLERFLAGVFGRPGVVLHGDTPVKKRMGLVDEFQREGGAPFFVLSLKAGGTGLNLTAASHVIHFDRWWNPAVENQATDRAYRIGQKRNVLVHKFICRGTIEERIDALIESKTSTSDALLKGGGEIALTELGNEELIRLVSLDIRSALEETDADLA